jgi:rhodanese-related sulfurtransferase
MSSVRHTYSVVLAKILVSAAALALGASAMAESQTPSTLAGGKVVSAEDAHKLTQKKAFFVDTRSVVNFGKGHVPGATAIPYKGNSDDVEGFDATKDQFDLSKLPAEKDRALVFYSDGPTGWKSYKASVWAIKAGYKNVNYMRSGWTEWQAKGLPAEN